MPQPEGGPSAWGAAAFISTVDEGLAGINDIGVNYEGWDKNDAKEYLEEYLSVDDELVDELYYSAIADPGVYIPYTYGQLRMWELREMAEDELEDSFDQKEYHEFLVDLGIVPFNVIENELKDWLRQ